MSNYKEITQLYEIIKDFEHPLHYEAIDDLGRLIDDYVELELAQEAPLRTEVVDMATNIYMDGYYAGVANCQLYLEHGNMVFAHLDQMRGSERFEELINTYAKIDPGYAIAFLASEKIERVSTSEFVENETYSSKSVDCALEAALSAGRYGHTTSDVRDQQEKFLSGIENAEEFDPYLDNVNFIDRFTLECIKEAVILPHNYLNIKHYVIEWQSIISEHAVRKIS